MQLKELEIKVGDFVLLEKHWLILCYLTKLAKFGSEFVGPFKIFEIVNNNLIIDVEGEKTTVHLDRSEYISYLEASPNIPDHVSLLLILRSRRSIYLMTSTSSYKKIWLEK